MAVLCVNNYKFSEATIKNHFGIYIENNVFYTKFGKVIQFPEKYLKACLKNKYEKEYKNITPVSQADKIKKYCKENHLEQDQFGIYMENGKYYTCLGEPIYNPKKYIEACLKNRTQKNTPVNPFAIFNNLPEEKVTFFSGNYDEVKEAIKNILKKNYNYSDIIILAKGKGNVEFIYNHLSYSLQEHCVKNVENQKDNILITTYSAIKNLNKKVCIFTDFDTISHDTLSSLNLSCIYHLYLHTKKQDSSALISDIRKNLKNNNI